MWGVNRQSSSDRSLEEIADARLSENADEKRSTGGMETMGGLWLLRNYLAIFPHINGRMVRSRCGFGHFGRSPQRTSDVLRKGLRLCCSTGWPPNAACAPEFFRCGFRDVREINL